MVDRAPVCMDLTLDVSRLRNLAHIRRHRGIPELSSFAIEQHSDDKYEPKNDHLMIGS